MNIALLGYGRMGKEVETIALEREHHVTTILDVASGPFSSIEFSHVDVAIDFTLPESAAGHIRTAFQHQLPIVVGTTGWYDELPAIQEACQQEGGALFYAPNFSIGVNILFELNKYLARLMNDQADYRPAIQETHHTGKKDAPSGTAGKLADNLAELLQGETTWQTLERSELPPTQPWEQALPVYYSREEGAIGTHTVRYQSDIDELSIQHQAYNRRGFALGAVKAAEWIRDKQGVFTMEDYLGIGG